MVPQGAPGGHARADLPPPALPARLAAHRPARGSRRRGLPRPPGDGLLGDRRRAARGRPLDRLGRHAGLRRDGWLPCPLGRPGVDHRPAHRPGHRPDGRRRPGQAGDTGRCPLAHHRLLVPGRQGPAPRRGGRPAVAAPARGLPGRGGRAHGRRPTRQGHRHDGAGRDARRPDGLLHAGPERHAPGHALGRARHAGAHPAHPLPPPEVAGRPDRRRGRHGGLRGLRLGTAGSQGGRGRARRHTGPVNPCPERRRAQGTAGRRARRRSHGLQRQHAHCARLPGARTAR
jgi:hypothetical protein